jgi:hypothetical protein
MSMRLAQCHHTIPNQTNPERKLELAIAMQEQAERPLLRAVAQESALALRAVAQESALVQQRKVPGHALAQQIAAQALALVRRVHGQRRLHFRLKSPSP